MLQVEVFFFIYGTKWHTFLSPFGCSLFFLLQISGINDVYILPGANEIVEDTLRITKNLMKSDLGKDILEISAVIEESFLAVQKSFTPQQRKDLTRRKYTFLDKEQLHQFYGENGCSSVFQQF